MTEHKTSDNDLLNIFNSDRSFALKKIYDEHAAVLFGLAFEILQDDEEAAKVVKLVFSQVISGKIQYDPAKGTLISWIYNTCRNHSIERSSAKDFVNANQPRIDQHQIPGKFLASFDDEYARILSHLYFEGLSQPEVAERLHIPLSTVKARARAAINHFR